MQEKSRRNQRINHKKEAKKPTCLKCLQPEKNKISYGATSYRVFHNSIVFEN